MHERSIEIDMTKGILTTGMVLAHVVQFLHSGSNEILNWISLITNLVSFSGFFFCFGYAVWIAYLQNRAHIPWASVLKTTLKCYSAFVISGVGYLALVKSQPLSLDLIIRVCFLRLIPGYSEFLISFSLITLFACIFSKSFHAVTNNAKNLAITITVLLGFTILPKEIDIDPVIGLIIGGSKFAYFPIIQYSPLFLLGVYFARHGKSYNWRYIVLSFLAAIAFLYATATNRHISRFPPSAAWILFSAGMVYLYYCAGYVLSKYSPFAIKIYFVHVGQNVLSYLIISSMVLFVSAALGLSHSLDFTGAAIYYVTLMIGIFFFHFIVTSFPQSHKIIDREA
jgi:hypothetical protein